MKRLISLMLFVCGMAAGMWAQSTSDVLNGVFTVSSYGQIVAFSKGNLQQKGGTWQFAEHQYDYLGDTQDRNSTTRDVFKFNDYSEPNGDDSWFVMTKNQWKYLLTTRSVTNTLSDGARYTMATLDGTYKGLILFPDSYTHPDGTGFTPGVFNDASNYTATVSLEGWSLMEAAGCVFLPAAGYWSVDGLWRYVGDGIVYSSSTPSGSGHRYTPWFRINENNVPVVELNDGDAWCHVNSYVPIRLVWSFIKKDDDGYYLLGSLQDWKDFASIVQETPSANARMTADINLGDDQTMIGTSDAKYQGIFDGQGHTLTINYVSSQNLCAPFLYIKNATLQNIHVAGTINTSHRRAAGLVAESYDISNINNSWSSVALISTYNGDAERGGFVSCVQGGTLTINDCYFDGTLTGNISYTWGGFVGWNKETSIANNCLFTPQSVSVYTKDSETFSNNGGTVTNCYYTVGIGTSSQGTQATAAQLADGTTATALQADRSETVWVQDPLTNQPMLKLFANTTYTMPTSGLGTFSAKAKFALPEGLEAYYCKDYDKTAGTISVVAIEGAVPAETGVLLRGTGGATYTLTGTNADAATVEDNSLVAVTEQTTIQQINGDYTNFGLSGGEFKMVNVAGGTVKANHAYLRILTSALTAGARSIFLVWDEDVTSVNDVRSKTDDVRGEYYNLNGQRVTHPTKGLYIVNGKKVIIK